MITLQRLRAVAQMLIAEIGADGPMDAEDAAAKAVQTIRSLRDWQAGAMAAAWISYPPGMPPHTEAVYCAHKADYMSRSEDYRLGADEVAAAILSVKEQAMQFVRHELEVTQDERDEARSEVEQLKQELSYSHAFHITTGPITIK